MLRRTLYGVALGIAVYVGATVYFGFGPVRAALTGYPWRVFAFALVLSAANYALRFAKWELALGWLNIRADAPNLSRGRSLLIYLAGLSMSVTPGKVGEVLRSVLLKSSDGIAFARTAPIVVADRLTDLVALVLLSLLGVSIFPKVVPVVVVTAVLVLAGVLVLGSPSLLRTCLAWAQRLPVVGRILARAEGLIESTTSLLHTRRLFTLTWISVLGWGCECVGFWLLLDAFAGVEATVRVCAFLWAAGTLVGALSFLPGGLGATEAGLVVAAGQLAHGVSEPVAVAATLLGRMATLWFGELVGVLALAGFLRDPALRARAAEVADERER